MKMLHCMLEDKKIVSLIHFLVGIETAVGIKYEEISEKITGDNCYEIIILSFTNNQCNHFPFHDDFLNKINNLK